MGLGLMVIGGLLAAQGFAFGAAAGLAHPIRPFRQAAKEGVVAESEAPFWKTELGVSDRGQEKALSERTLCCAYAGVLAMPWWLISTTNGGGSVGRLARTSVHP